MKFIDFLNPLNPLNEYKLLGKIKPYNKILYNSYIDFLNDYFGTSLKIELSVRKPTNKLYFGYIDLRSLSVGKYKIIVEDNFGSILDKIGHEFTHCVQFKKKILGFNNEETHITWKGKDYISIKELNKISDINEYKKLPWEKEAYTSQDKLPGLYKKSKYYKELKGQDASLDYLIDNDGI